MLFVHRLLEASVMKISLLCSFLVLSLVACKSANKADGELAGAKKTRISDRVDRSDGASVDDLSITGVKLVSCKFGNRIITGNYSGTKLNSLTVKSSFGTCAIENKNDNIQLSVWGIAPDFTQIKIYANCYGKYDNDGFYIVNPNNSKKLREGENPAVIRVTTVDSEGDEGSDDVEGTCTLQKLQR